MRYAWTVGMLRFGRSFSSLKMAIDNQALFTHPWISFQRDNIYWLKDLTLNRKVNSDLTWRVSARMGATIWSVTQRKCFHPEVTQEVDMHLSKEWLTNTVSTFQIELRSKVIFISHIMPIPLYFFRKIFSSYLNLLNTLQQRSSQHKTSKHFCFYFKSI